MITIALLALGVAGDDASYRYGLERARNADLSGARNAFAKVRSAEALHAAATLKLIAGDLEGCVAARREAKALDASALPPLAVLFQNGDDCGGLGDVYWSAAFVAKALHETADGGDAAAWASAAADAHAQLSVALEDSGALAEATAHVAKAVALRPADAALRFRAALLVPAVQAVAGAGAKTYARLERNVAALRGSRLAALDATSMPGTFYVVYLGFADAALMAAIADAYRAAHPALGAVLHEPAPGDAVRVGFVSSYWKRHSVCKLLGGVVRGLAATPGFAVTLFSAAEEEDDWTAWVLETGAARVRLERGVLLSNRDLAKSLDVLVFADLGMDAKTTTWAFGRLARTQVLFWGHPHTSGLPDTVDYFITSDAFEPRNDFLAERYAEQPARFDTLGFYFRAPQGAYAPTLAETDARAPALAGELGLGDYDALYVCPQSLPKFHPDFDEVLVRLAFAISRRGGQKEAIVITYDPKKLLWLRALERRLEASIAKYAARPGPVLARFVFLPLVAGPDFFALLRLATVLLDPFPFGGGVTTLEAFSACRAVVTAPRRQSVVALARGMYRRMNVPGAPVAATPAAYVANATALADDAPRRRALEAAICAARGALFERDDAVDEWARFLARASR